MTEEEQMLPLALQDLNLNDSILMNRPVCLREFITKLKNNQKILLNNKGILTQNLNHLIKSFLFI